MMLNLKFKNIKLNLILISTIVIVVSLIIISVISWYNDYNLTFFNKYNLEIFSSIYRNKLTLIDNHTLLQSLSNLIYTDYYLMLLLVGFVLLIGFIGAILITFEKKSIKKFNLNKVLTRTTFLKKQLK